MKVAGYEGGLDRDTFTIERKDGSKLSFLFTALPLGITEDIDKELVPPIPPREGFCRDHKRKFVRDDLGRPVPFYNEKDPEFTQAVKEINRLQTVAMLIKSLENDPNVSWETARADCKGMREYCSRIYDEMRSFGLSTGELTQMVAFMLKLSKLGEQELEGAKEDFLED